MCLRRSGYRFSPSDKDMAHLLMPEYRQSILYQPGEDRIFSVTLDNNYIATKEELSDVYVTLGVFDNRVASVYNPYHEDRLIAS